ncbi:hypothetical protein KI387_002755, partial [Taxus chinensis]
ISAAAPQLLRDCSATVPRLPWFLRGLHLKKGFEEARALPEVRPSQFEMRSLLMAARNQ